MATCSVCGEESPPRARYCWSCGSLLAAPGEPPREVRKTVTVVFCDLAGSTALAADRDPEALRRVLTRYFEEMRSVLEQHGGTVEKFIGDAVMAVFGTPVVREDDAIRAVRAALEMRSRVPSLNEAFRREWGMSIAVRLGVNTGEVVAGDAAARQTFVTGEAVNVAQRLESAAPANQILIGADTYRLVRDLVEVEAVAPLFVRGKDRPVEAYRLLGLRAAAARRDSPMVGRSRELAALVEAFAGVLEARECRLVPVVGDAGVGKSRLLAELVRSVEGDALAVTGRCLPYGEGITYFPLIEVLRRVAGIAEEDDDDSARAKLAELAGDDVARPLRGVLGLAPAAAVEETSWAVASLVEALGRRRPLLLAFDDVQWAEPTLLDLLEHLHDRVRDAPVLLVCLTRPDLAERRAAFAEDAILLDPLEDDDAVRLIGNLLGGGELDRDLRARILEAAGGNPLFVEEMLSMLLEEGLVVEREGLWVARDDVAAVPVPATIQVLLASRLDQLREPERVVVERAAVVGKEFERRSLAALTPQLGEPELRAALDALERKELIVPVRDAELFAFRHILIRDAAYESLSKHVRAQLHEELAGWMEASSRGPEVEEIEAYHLEQAFRYRGDLGPVDERVERLGRRGAVKLAAAGRRALERDDVPAAISILRRATALPLDGTSYGEAAVALGVALRENGRLGEAREILARLVQDGEAGDPRLAALARVEHAYLDLYAGVELSIERLATIAEDAIAVFERAGDDRGLVRALNLLGFVHWTRCRGALMRDVLTRALDRAASLGNARETTLILAGLARSALIGPVPVDDAVRETEEIARHARASISVAATCSLVLGCLSAMAARFEAARSRLAEAKAIYDQQGRTLAIAAAHGYAGEVELLAGDAAAAERELRRGRELLAPLTDATQAAAIATLLARALLLEGRDDGAASLAEEAARAASADDLATQVGWRATAAVLRARAGEREDALRLAREAVALAEPTDHLNLRGDAHAALAHVQRELGDVAAAAAAASVARGLYLRKGNVAAAAQVEPLLAVAAAG